MKNFDDECVWFSKCDDAERKIVNDKYYLTKYLNKTIYIYFLLN